LILGVVAISFSPLVVKMVSFSPTVSAFYRSLYATIFLFMWSGLRFKGELGRRNLRWYAPILIAGVSLGIDFILWHKTIFYLGAGPATFLGNSQVIFVTIFAALMFKERIPFSFIIYLVVILVGLYLLMPALVNTVNRPLGYIYGMIVGITYAIMLIGMRYAKSKAGENYPELFSLAVLFLASTAVIGLHLLFVVPEPLLVPDVRSHLLMAITSLFAQAIGWYLIKTNITKIPAHEGSLFLILQPILAMAWGHIFFSEPVTMVQLTGIIMASGGIVLFLWKKGCWDARWIDKSHCC